MFPRAELQNTQRVGDFFTFLFFCLVYETSQYSVVFCNLNVSCSLSCNANKLPAHKLLTSLCIFISDGHKRVWMPIFKSKRIKRVVLLYSSNSPIGDWMPQWQQWGKSRRGQKTQPDFSNPWHLHNQLPSPQGWNGCLHYTHTSRVVYQPFGFRFNLKTSCSFFYINIDIRKHFSSGDNSWGCLSLVTTCQEYYLFYWRSKLRGNTYFWNKYYFLNSLSNFTTHYKHQNKPSITSQPLQKILFFFFF